MGRWIHGSQKPDALSNVPAIPLKIANVKNKYNHLSRPDVFTFIAGTVKRRFIKSKKPTMKMIPATAPIYNAPSWYIWSLIPKVAVQALGTNTPTT